MTLPTARRLLVIGPAWVGDMVMAHSLLQVLRRQDPEAVIDVLAPPFALPLTARMPEVRRAIPLAIGHRRLGLQPRWRLAKELRGQYDRAIVLPRSLKSALLPWLARIPERVGYLGELRYGLLTEPRPLERERLPRTVDRFVALGLPQGTPLPDPLPRPSLAAHWNDTANTLHELAIPYDGRPILVLCPGAEYGPAKQWPVEHFAAVARDRLARQWNVWLLGGAKERLLCDRLVEQGGIGCLNLAGRTTLPQAVNLLHAARAVVTNDSGLMHVAAALHRPMVALFGSSDPRHTPPLDDQARVISLDLPCSPCFHRTCPKGGDPPPCLADISPGQVLAILDNLP